MSKRLGGQSPRIALCIAGGLLLWACNNADKTATTTTTTTAVASAQQTVGGKQCAGGTATGAWIATYTPGTADVTTTTATTSTTAAAAAAAATGSVAAPPSAVPAPGMPQARARLMADSAHRVSKAAQTLYASMGWCNAGVPEYEDAQAFIKNKKIYGPVAKSLSSPNVGNYTSHTDFDAGLVTVGTVEVDPGELNEAYTRLNLTNGLNCVYLKHLDTAPAKWVAKIAPPSASGTNCDPTSAETMGAPDITAIDQDRNTAYPDSIPPVTRWVEGNDWMPNLGVRCGDAWCVIGPDAAAVPASGHDADGNKPTSVQAQVKGWFDDQNLAEPDLANPGKLKPNARATIVPAADLGKQTLDDFGTTWVKAAMVYMPANAPKKYEDNFGFKKGWNTIYLHGHGVLWEAHIIDAKGFTHVRTVTRTPHGGTSLPATARWAWQENDEWVWIACYIGCCLVEAGKDS